MIPVCKALTKDGWIIGHAYAWQGNYFIEQSPSIYQVTNPETISISTGLKDFCDDEIFEGDILCVDLEEGEVRWQQREGRWVVVFDDREVMPLAKIKRTAYIVCSKWDTACDLSDA